MKNASLLYTTVAVLAATSSSAFHLPQTRATTSNNRVVKTNHPTPLHQTPSVLAVAPIAIAALIFSFTPPSMAIEGDITKGKEIFTSTCAGCHLGGQNFVKQQKTLQKDALEKFVGLDEEKVEKFFKGSFVHKVIVGDKKLSDDDITDVVTFVVDQATNEKW